MTKTLIASLVAAGLYSASAAMANTSADTAPDRLPMATSAASTRAPMATAPAARTVWEGGEASTLVSMPAPAATRTGRIAMGSSAAPSEPSLIAQGQPYQSGSAN